MDTPITAPTNLDPIWVLFATTLVFLMQAGFCLLESGLVRTKNSINVAVKNLMDCFTSMLVYAAIGFPLMFGADVMGLVGSPGSLDMVSDGRLITFFLFQVVFCSTATTIVSGAIAERTRLTTFLFIVLLLSGLVYPVVGHWIWGGILPGSGQGWLARIGFLDFAGSTAVHVVGGFCALAAAMVIGPRRQIPSQQTTGGHSLTLAVLGCFLLWFGWWGFNGGSCLSLTENLPMVLLNTQAGAAAGGLTAAMICIGLRRRVEVIPLISGVLAGLVSVTAGCDQLTPFGSALAGAIGSALALWSDAWLRKKQIDDVVSAFPVHGVAGFWGTIATFLLMPIDSISMGERLTGVGIQALGTTVVAAVTFASMYAGLSLLKRITALRVTEEEEIRGLNMVEHGATNEVLDLVTEMSTHQHEANFSKPVRVEPHTEAGQIAAQYNRVIAKVQEEMSEREKSNDWLKSERLRLQSVLEHAGVGIYQLDSAGAFTSVNHTLLDTLGYKSAAELIDGKPVEVAPWLVGSDNESVYRDSIQAAVSVKDLETCFERRDGSEVWLLESLVPIHNDDGQLISWLGTVHDITTRRQQMIAEVEIAEARSQAKGEFLANMSHEIRTPLNGVIGMLDLLNGSDMSEQDTHYVNIARSSADSLLSVINDILDFSKIEAGRMDLEEVQFDLRDLVESTSEQFAVRAHLEGLELNCAMSSDVPSGVIGDPERLRQVLTNLMGNAIKFTRKGEINLRVTTDTERIRFAVEDTGIGMSEEQCASIFEAFTQADASTTREFGGTGLGLSISYQLVQLMGGQLDVTSTAGQGSTFFFDLPMPVVANARMSNERMQELLARLPDTRVLVVDDNETNCEILRNQLALWGFTAETCQCSEMAADRLMLANRNGKPFDLMLLDMCMPVMDGKDVARLVRSSGLFSDLPIILLSSNHEILSTDDRIACGIDIAMTKPVRQSRLFDSIITTIEKRMETREQRETRMAEQTAGIAPVTPHSDFSTPIVPDFDEQVAAGQPEATATRTPATTRQSPPPAPAPAVTKLAAPQGSDNSSADVLVVEDNQVNQVVVRQMLSSLGHTSHVAENGQEAIDKLQKAAYRIVFMDGHMPVLDGLKATSTIRRMQSENRLSQNSNVPIVALTANANSTSRDDFLAAGVDCFLTKPVTLSRLKEALEHMLDSEHIPAAMPNVLADPTPAMTASVAATTTPAATTAFAAEPSTDIPVHTAGDVRELAFAQPEQSLVPSASSPLMEQTTEPALETPEETFTAAEAEAADASHTSNSAAGTTAAVPKPVAALQTELFDETGFALRCGSDRAFQKQVLTLMRGTMSDTVAQIRTAHQNGDLETLRGVTHRLKGAAGDCALLAVATAAGALESAVRESRATDIQDGYETLRVRVDETLDLLNELLCE
ncbi:MAG: ammonium transporter [Planctomycetaceae bacterium]|nr:ammonium transporter [Planctomycetaceae bacterium]